MSIKAMTTVWESQLECTRKIIMLYYADRANDEGENVWPSVETVAERASLTTRSVQRITKSMVDDGLLVLAGHGPKGTNRYRIDLMKVREYQAENPISDDAGGDSVSGGDTVSGVTLTTKRGDTVSGGVTLTTKRGDTVSPEPSLTIIEPPLNRQCGDAKNFHPSPENAGEVWNELRADFERQYGKLIFHGMAVLDEVSSAGWRDEQKFLELEVRNSYAAEYLSGRCVDILNRLIVGQLGRMVKIVIKTGDLMPAQV